jgi:hypothetical protein
MPQNTDHIRHSPDITIPYHTAEAERLRRAHSKLRGRQGASTSWSKMRSWRRSAARGWWRSGGWCSPSVSYPYEVRKAEDYFCDLPDLTIAPDMRTLAEHILDSKAAEFDPALFRASASRPLPRRTG